MISLIQTHQRMTVSEAVSCGMLRQCCGHYVTRVAFDGRVTSVLCRIQLKCCRLEATTIYGTFN